jgi:hypothetical protein
LPSHDAAEAEAIRPANYSLFETLRDGRPVEIRALRSDDRADFIAPSVAAACRPFTAVSLL